MASKLRYLRESQALSLTDLARISGVNRITIYRIEAGKQKPMPRTIRKLAEALNVDVQELTRGQILRGNSRFGIRNKSKPHNNYP